MASLQPVESAVRPRNPTMPTWQHRCVPFTTKII